MATKRRYLFGGFIQSEPFTIRTLGEGDHGHSLVIPLPQGRALRVGFRWRSWCKLGPRRYTLIATPRFVEGYERIGGTVEELRNIGVQVQGDLKAVD